MGKIRDNIKLIDKDEYLQILIRRVTILRARLQDAEMELREYNRENNRKDL